MKRVRCPKCQNYILFDETKYKDGQSLVFVCDECNKQFSIRIGVSKLKATRKEEKIDEQIELQDDAATASRLTSRRTKRLSAASLSSRISLHTSRLFRCERAITRLDASTATPTSTALSRQPTQALISATASSMLSATRTANSYTICATRKARWAYSTITTFLETRNR